MDSLESAYILHSRLFRDTSLIVELYTREHGRISVLAKGARKNHSWKGILQVFTPLLVAWRGKSELPLLTKAEAKGVGVILQGNALVSGLYLNELLIRLLHKHDPHPFLFDDYRQALSQLNTKPLQPTLRVFEKCLLRRIGYELILDREVQTNQPIQPGEYYHYHFDQGAIKAEGQQVASKDEQVYLGQSLLDFHQEQFHHTQTLRDAKHLMRQMLSVVLDHRPLKSRELFS